MIETFWFVRLDDGEMWKNVLVSMLPFRGLSVCHVRALCSNGRRYWHNFFCIRQLYV